MIKDAVLDISEQLVLEDLLGEQLLARVSIEESLNFTDSFYKKTLWNLAELLQLDDDVTITKSIVKSISESLDLTDDIRKLKSVTQSISESLVLSDSIS
ncbi:MAG: hypothetical protein VW683_16500, partial [Betaproteobacteria bacterium]